MNEPVPHNHVAIIGTGFGALAAAVRLHQAGVDGVVLIDHDSDDDMMALHWQADRQRWHLTTPRGEQTATHIVVDTDALADRLFGTKGVSMAESWGDEPVAYLGTSVHGFPNCYLVHGPNIGLRHNSVDQMRESQADYIAATVSYARDFGFAAVEPTPAAQQNYAIFRPRTTADFRRRVTRFTPRDHLVQRPVREPAVSAADHPATGSC
jgi:cation diffusion facilitator CzcD-associated flavoprotein CzcO